MAVLSIWVLTIKLELFDDENGWFVKRKDDSRLQNSYGENRFYDQTRISARWTYQRIKRLAILYIDKCSDNTVCIISLGRKSQFYFCTFQMNHHSRCVYFYHQPNMLKMLQMHVYEYLPVFFKVICFGAITLAANTDLNGIRPLCMNILISVAKKDTTIILQK